MKDAWDTIIDKEFWTSVGTVLDVLRPVYKLLRNVDGNQEVMGKIYDKMFVLEDAVKEACKELTEEEKEDVTDILRNRWNNDISCALHVVGRILYPPNQYESIFGTDVECTKIFKQFIRNYYKGEFVKVGGVTAPLATIVEKEVLTYIKGKGDIGEQKARDEHELIKAGLLDSAHWWEFNGTDVPHLSKLAKRVLKQCVSASPCETNWAVWESIHTARRNRLGAKRLADLVYVSHNYHTVKKLNEDLAKKLVVSGLPVVQVKEEPNVSYGHLDDDDILDEAYLDGQEAEEPMELETPSFKLLGIILIISVGVLCIVACVWCSLPVAGETEFELVGFILVMLASFMAGLRWPHSACALCSPTHCACLTNPLLTLEYLAPVMAPVCRIFSLLHEPLSSLASSPYFDK
ncbi:unnamed protein product [Closterium sp. NIES-65]|nr:unnamed protein product [Closterium sp. NIES-65]